MLQAHAQKEKKKKRPLNRCNIFRVSLWEKHIEHVEALSEHAVVFEYWCPRMPGTSSQKHRRRAFEWNPTTCVAISIVKNAWQARSHETVSSNALQT